ncbi:hypothetical protein K402DRAFT_391361 [Aulographum hederae CBS 113979]|uniref:Uncharacterized protein n=1 Tax=Aulographum hederae CBS 113979 TaxID=1176131 RepID=A0A6G1H7K3_9PEZI|nr:hypothetical protein K402DRAFT_391361 [Aulographum hederae CBS 113979]
MSAQVTLFDLASNDGKGCWSPYTWKVRLCLNYKQIPYETKFIEYPAVNPTLEQLNIPTNDPSVAHGYKYSIPCARLPDGTYTMDSIAICRRLETFYPPIPTLSPPSLRFDDPITEKITKLVNDFDGPLAPNFMFPCSEILNAESRKYFDQKRSADYGKSLKALLDEDGGEKAWAKAKPAMDGIAELLQKNDRGPFLLGFAPCYADFIIVAFIEFLRRLDERLFERVTKHHQAFEELYEACTFLLDRKRD